MPPAAPSRRMTDTTRFKLYEWGEWASRALIMATAALMWQTYVDVQAIKAKQDENERRLNLVEARVEQVRSESLMKSEAMEMMKRLELLMGNIVKDEEIKRLGQMKGRK